VIIQCIDEEGIQKEFIVHKDLITQYSPHYFHPMFGGDFQEGQAQSVVLDEIPSVASFGLFVHWLYTQSIQGTGPSAMDLVNIWILADKALIPTLQNQVIEEFAKLEIEQVPTQLFPRVYQQQVWEGSALRALVVDMCVGQIGKLKIDETFPREMLIDIVRAGAELLPTKATKLSKEKVKRYLIPEESLDRSARMPVVQSLILHEY
jgi:hypothetical protein